MSFTKKLFINLALKNIFALVSLGLFSLPSTAEEFEYYFNTMMESEKNMGMEEPIAEDKEEIKSGAIGTSSLSSPVLSEENSKGYYFTGSIGANRINDIDIVGTASKITFDDGLGFDLGVGYDFGKTRIEATWIRGQSRGGVSAGNAFTDDTILDSLTLSGYYDFRSTKKWSPFVGISMASTKVEFSGVDDTGFSYGLALGVSYKTSDSAEVFVKSHALVTPEFDLGTIKIENGSYGNGTIGLRYLF